MKLLAVGGILGPAAFFFGWLYLGLARPGYEPVSTAISELARTGQTTAPAMTVAFLSFSVGLSALMMAVRKQKRLALVIAIAVIGSTGVAACPLGSADNAHFAFAAVSYVGLTALPLVAARNLGGKVSLVTGAIIAACLILSVVGPASVHGLFQRLGLTVADLWIITYSLKQLAGPKPS